MMVTDLLVEHFPKVMDLKFTSHMEEELDQIEERKAKRDDVLQRVLRAVPPGPEGGRDQDAGRGRDEKCPQCGKPLVERFSKVGQVLRLLGLSGVQVHQAARGRSAARSARCRPSTCAPSAASRCCSAWAGAGRSWAAAAIPSARRP